MKSSYDEIYLSDVQKNLGFLFQFMLCNMTLNPEEAQNAFLNSIIPHQIEIANPDFLCGKSGLELASFCFADKDISTQIKQSLSEPFYPQAEYWCGYVLAYIQWRNKISFNDILNAFPLEMLLSSYNLYHEADISKIEEAVMGRVKEIIH